jgi:thiol-disulfide isomerase/thioredoxin
MTTKEIISEIASRDVFFHILKNNPGLVVIKFGAKWCGPCKNIHNVVQGFFLTSPVDVVCADIDVDECFDLYSFLKSKKMVNGIPAILCYQKGNHTFISDDAVTGADPVLLHSFFKRCGNRLNHCRRNLLKNY